MAIRSPYRASLLLAVLGLVFLAPGAAQAQYQYQPPYSSYGSPPDGPPLDRAGLYLGFGAFGDTVINQANSAVDFLTSGAGYNLMLGLRLSPNLALEFGLGQGYHNNVTSAWGDTVDYLVLTQVTADAKLILPLPGGQLQPFFQGGVGFYYLADAYSSGIASGGGFQLGGGLDFWMNPLWSVGGRLLYHGIQFTSFDEPQVGRSSSPFLSTVSLEFNAQIHF
jgi:hypothetical protein